MKTDLEIAMERSNQTAAFQREISSLKEQLAAERAKVALAVETLQAHELYCGSDKEHEEAAYNNFARLKYKSLAALQSSDALATVRREVARECVEIADDIAGNIYLWNQIRTGGALVALAIRAKFGVEE